MKKTNNFSESISINFEDSRRKLFLTAKEVGALMGMKENQLYRYLSPENDGKRPFPVDRSSSRLRIPSNAFWGWYDRFFAA